MTLKDRWAGGLSVLIFMGGISISKADTTVRYVSVNQGGEVIAVERLHITKTKMAMTQEGSKVTTVFDAKKGELFTIDRENGVVTVIDPKAVAKKAEQQVETRAKVLEGMEAKLAKMTPEEREKLKGVMDEIHEANRRASEEPPPVTYKARPKLEKIGDFEARVVDSIRGKRKAATYFLVTREKIGIEPDELAVLEAFQFFIHKMAEGMPAGGSGGFGDFDLLVSNEGEIPVQKVKFSKEDGSKESQEILNGVDHEPVSDDLFNIPEDYKRQGL